MNSSHQAFSWIASHHRRIAELRGMLVVIKVGGSIQDDPAQMRGVMRDVAAIASLGARPVVIHGGGKAISAAMNAAGLKPHFVQGQRYTDDATLRIVEDVLVNRVNRELAGYLRDEGARPVPLHSLGERGGRSTCVIEAVRTGTDATPERPAEDLGHVGRVTRVDVQAIIDATQNAGTEFGGKSNSQAGPREGIPLIAPVALTAGKSPGGVRTTLPDGSAGFAKLNVNADVAAGTIAAALHPGLFVLVSDTPGVRIDPKREDSYVQHLSRDSAAQLIRTGIIGGGMLPKINACFEARDAGVDGVAIVDGRVPGSLLATVVGRESLPIAGTWVE